jgi:hypothetical protein
MTALEQTPPLPDALRRRLAADFVPVRPLPSPARRALWAVPFAVLALVAAPLWFSVRGDTGLLGFWQSWGVSLAQAALGLAVVVAALRDAVPGRTWAPGAVALWLGLPVACVVLVAWTTWWTSQELVPDPRLLIAGMCFGGSLAAALPIVAVTAVLTAGAFPTRPFLTGLLAGVGAGTVADAGWRMFCHYTEPAHVLSAHLGGVLVAGLCGALLSAWLARRRLNDSCAG